MTYEYFSPGRVNLIGEHTDYNGGHVFPCALSMGIQGEVTPRQDRKFTFRSKTFPRLSTITLTLEDIAKGPRRSWTDYPAGVLSVLQKHGVRIPFGFDLVVDATLPNGSGLSSSAALEMLILVIAQDLYGLNDLSRIDLALLAKEAENTYVGVNCGIMDSFAISLGKADQAMFLDTGTLDFEYVPLMLGDAKIVIANTNKKRALAASAYNTRRSECEQVLAIINRSLAETPASYGLPAHVDSLCTLKVAEWNRILPDVKDPVLRKRANHAVYENYRTELAVKALTAGNLAEFGHLMNNSHLSLKADYQVTGDELDTLVAAAHEEPGCIGSRMTGAGFGGCTVSLVQGNQVEDFIDHVGEKYKKAIGYSASFYIADVGEGSRKL